MPAKKYSKEYIHRELQKFANNCKKNKYIPTTKELLSTAKGKRLYYFILWTHGSKKDFAKTYGLEDIYNFMINEKRTEASRKALAKLRNERLKNFKKEIFKHVITINGKKLIAKNKKDFQNQVFGFSYTDFLQKNDIEKVPLHFVNFVKKIQKEKEKNGYIDVKKWNKHIKKNSKIMAYIYKRYGKKPIQKMIEEFKL